MHRRFLGRGILLLAAVCVGGARAQETGDDPADRAVIAALEKTHAFAYKDRAFLEVLADIGEKAQIEIVFDPQVEADIARITWSSRQSTVRRALAWVMRLADLAYDVRDGAVFVSTADRLAGDVVQKVYDIRDLTEPPGHRPGPLLGFAPPATPPSGREYIFEESSLAEMITTRIRPSSWAAELGTSIDQRDGLLIVLQLPDIHTKVLALLDDLRRMRRRAVRVDVVAVASSAAASIRAKARAGTLDAKDLTAFLAAAPKGTVVTSGTIATLDGLTAHTLWGSKVHYLASKQLDWPRADDPSNSWMQMQHEVIETDGGPKVVVIKTPTPIAAPPPGEGVLVPVMDALLDGVMMEVLPRLQDEGKVAELSLRLVISHPKPTAPEKTPPNDSPATPQAEYSRLHTTVRLPLGFYGLAGQTSVPKDNTLQPVDILVRVTVTRK